MSRIADWMIVCAIGVLVGSVIALVCFACATSSLLGVAALFLMGTLALSAAI